MSLHEGGQRAPQHPPGKRPRKRRRYSKPKGRYNPNIAYVRLADAARQWGVCPSTIGIWLRRNHLRWSCAVVDHQLLIPVEFIERWVKATGRNPELQEQTQRHERLTSEAAAELLGVGDKWINKLAKKGKLRRYRSGPAFYYLRSEVERLKRDDYTRPPAWKIEVFKVAAKLGRETSSIVRSFKARGMSTAYGWSPDIQMAVPFVDVNDAQRLLEEYGAS